MIQSPDSHQIGGVSRTALTPNWSSIQAMSFLPELSTQALQHATTNSPVNFPSSVGSGQGKAVVNTYSSWEECAFRTVGLLVLQVPPDERDYATPRYVPMRHLVTWLILFYFVLTTGYSAGLATVLTIPRYILYYSFDSRGTAIAQWLRCSATHRKVAGSIPDCVIFH